MSKQLVFFILICMGLVACGGEIATAPKTELTVSPSTSASTATDLPRLIDVETAAQLQSRDDVLLIDVREQWEYDAGHIPGITHIPMGEIASRLAEIPADQTVILTCQVGGRSRSVTQFLVDQGYENVHDMAGGFSAWESAGYATE